MGIEHLHDRKQIGVETSEVVGKKPGEDGAPCKKLQLGIWQRYRREEFDSPASPQKVYRGTQISPASDR
jgi:hypothetical protein